MESKHDKFLRIATAAKLEIDKDYHIVDTVLPSSELGLHRVVFHSNRAIVIALVQGFNIGITNDESFSLDIASKEIKTLSGKPVMLHLSHFCFENMFINLSEDIL